MTRITGPNGQVVQVDDENRMLVSAVTQHEDKHLNTEEKYWSAYFKVTTAAVDDYFFYLKNTGLKDLYVTDIRVSSSIALNTMHIDYVTGTASAGTDSQITNRNLGSPGVPTAIIQHDANFTGITNGGVIFFQKTDVANRHFHLKTSGNIIVPQGQAFAIRSDLAATIEAVVSISEAE